MYKKHKQLSIVINGSVLGTKIRLRDQATSGIATRGDIDISAENSHSQDFFSNTLTDENGIKVNMNPVIESSRSPLIPENFKNQEVFDHYLQEKEEKLRDVKTDRSLKHEVSVEDLLVSLHTQ